MIHHDQSDTRASRRTEGFSLTEMLAATLVLVLATGLVASGVDLARRSYVRTQFESEANVLASTINNALAGSFRFWTDSDTISLNGYTVSNPIVDTDDGGHLIIKGSKIADGNGNAPSTGNQMSLINEGSYGEGQHGACMVSKVEPYEDDESHLSSDNDSRKSDRKELHLKYTISSVADSSLSHTYNICVRSNGKITINDTNALVSGDSGSGSDADDRGSGGAGVADPDAPKDGTSPTKPTDSMIFGYTSPFWDDYATAHAVWNVRTQGSDISYVALKSPYNDSYGLIYYDKRYYRPKRAGGSDYFSTPLTGFSVSHLSDGQSHDYGWNAIVWEECTNQ